MRWQKDVGGIVLGAASVVGEVAYVGVIGPNIGTFGFDVKTGKQVFEHEFGEYNPVISDGRRLYLTGSSGIRAFEHKQKKPKPDKPKPDGGGKPGGGGKPKPEGSGGGGKPKPEGSGGGGKPGSGGGREKPQGDGKPKPRHGGQGHGGKKKPPPPPQANFTPPKPGDVTPDQGAGGGSFD